MKRNRPVTYTLKSPAEIDAMRQAGAAVAAALQAMRDALAPGVTTLELDALAGDTLRGLGATSALLNYKPPFADVHYLHNTCISVGNEVLHGVPSATKRLKAGDLVKLDLAASVDGWCADSAVTVLVGGKGGERAEKILSVTRDALWNAIRVAVAGNTMGDVSHAMQRTIERGGMGVVTDLVGHGIGRTPHEEGLDVPCVGKPGSGPKLVAGMTFCIEPMVTCGSGNVEHLGTDPWTIVSTADTLGAHFEHTVAITADGPPLVLTKLPAAS
ncbi:MAG: type I methionyl aminopeptidase [Armatimonadota bacterium]